MKFRSESYGDEKLQRMGSLSEMVAKLPTFGFVKHFIILYLHIKRTSAFDWFIFKLICSP